MKLLKKKTPLKRFRKTVKRQKTFHHSLHGINQVKSEAFSTDMKRSSRGTQRESGEGDASMEMSNKKKACGKLQGIRKNKGQEGSP